jgi:uncharacterized integral membrane protein (TIGR00698 family)
MKTVFYKNFQGIFLSFFLSAFAYILALYTPLKELSLSPLIVAILLGFFYANIFDFSHKKVSAGLDFSTTKILRFAIVFYGFQITFIDILSVGYKGVLISALVVISTLLLGFFIARKYFKLDTHLSLLISCGSAICGAAAVLATESVLKSDANKTAIAIATVVIFGTLSMFLYPLFYHAGFITLPHVGTYIGSTLHEVAHVVTASSSISAEVAHEAIIVKMIRVMMIAPVLLFIPFLLQSQGEKRKIIIPWFAVYFIFVAAFNSFDLLPKSLLELIQKVDIFLLCMAMSALGAKTKFKALIKVGLKPFLLAFILFLWLIFGGYGINALLS